MARRHEVFVTDEQWEQIRSFTLNAGVRREADVLRQMTEHVWKASSGCFAVVLAGEICLSDTRRPARAGDGWSSGKVRMYW